MVCPGEVRRQSWMKQKEQQMGEAVKEPGKEGGKLRSDKPNPRRG
jgi:hypothetical protein